jgi:hypothetical protein
MPERPPAGGLSGIEAVHRRTQMEAAAKGAMRSSFFVSDRMHVFNGTSLKASAPLPMSAPRLAAAAGKQYS